MRYFWFTLIFFTFAILGCTENIENEVVSNGSDIEKTFSNSISFTISSEEAMSQAISFAKQARTTRTAMNIEAESVIPWLSKDIWNLKSTRSGESAINLPDTALYVVNMRGGDGYALVSADMRVPGVMAFIDKGSFTPGDTLDNPGFKIFLDGLRNYYYREIISKGSKSSNRSNDPFYTYTVYVEPMLETNWGQGTPYNKYCFTSQGLQAVAGCVAIAVAQITAYHQWPESFNGHQYDWDSILASDTVNPTDTTASNSVGHLIHDIGELVNMDYGVSVSTAFDSDVSSCWYEFDYYYTWHNTSPSFDTVNSDLQAGLPVYCRGTAGGVGSHAWVIDGSSVLRGFVRIFGPSGTQTELLEIQHISFVHCNWGWNGYNNGYFIYGAFENKDDGNYGTYTNSSFYPFNQNIKSYTGVQPDYLSLWE